jgi:AcrR family transcriptional regulator
VAATLRIVENEGTGAVSLSAAARRVGVSPQATYNHFRDKADLLAAAAEEAVHGLELEMRDASAAACGAGERLEATGIAYVRFAYTHAAKFRLLSAPELANKSRHPALLLAYESAFGVLLSAIVEAQGAGVVREGSPRELAVAAWATVHGIAWLVVDGQISISNATNEPTDAARDAIRILFKGLRAARRMPAS